MIYHLSLHSAGIVAGVFLIALGLIGLTKPDVASVVQRFPRSRVAGVVLLTICLVWTFWLVATIQMGDFSSFRRPLLIALPMGYVLALFFVDEFLAVRALGILDRKSTRLNSSPSQISNAAFCLKKKTNCRGIPRPGLRTRHPPAAYSRPSPRATIIASGPRAFDARNRPQPTETTTHTPLRSPRR